MKIAILTSSINMGTVKDPQYNNYSIPGTIDYYAFVDHDHGCTVWNQMSSFKFSNVDPVYGSRRNAKLPKILGSFLLPGYDYYIWHDNHCEVFMDPTRIITDILGDKDMALFKHPRRDCVYEEINEVAQSTFDTSDNLDAVRNFLRSVNYPEHSGLFELTSFAYKSSHKISEAMWAWWELLCRFSSRDQITFPYIANKYGITYNIIPGAALAYGGNNNVIPSIRWKTT